MSLDSKGRLAIPSRYRAFLSSEADNFVVLTLSPFDLCLWLYPLPAWQQIDFKLETLSDFDRESRRVKQIMRGNAMDCQLDAQGRILVSKELRGRADIVNTAVIRGQGNKFDLWNASDCQRQLDEWKGEVRRGKPVYSETLKDISL